MSSTTLGDFLLKVGLHVVISTSVISCTFTLLIFHKRIMDSISVCLCSTKSLNAKTGTNKVIALICAVFFWHWPVIAFYQPWDILQNLVVVSVDVQICFILFLLEESVKALNKSVKEHYDFSMLSRNNNHPFLRDEICLKTKQPTGPVAKLRHIYSLLYGVIQATNKCYSVPAFLITLFCRFLFTLYLYRWLNQEFYFMNLLKAWISFQRILYICYRFECLKLEEARLSEQLNNLEISPLDSKTKLEYKLFLIQVHNFPLTFTSMQLFVLDFSLISSMFTSTMTYLLLLTQL